MTNGVEPDGREGAPPPPLEQGDLATSAEEAKCVVEEDLPDEGNAHVDEPPEYGTNPATSGDHVPPPDFPADGAYAEPVDPFFYVHAHEHARVTIHYSPDLPERDQLALKGVFEEDPAAVLMFPDPNIEGDVAMSSWSALMNCRGFEGRATLDAVRNFRDEFRGAYNPEQVPLSF
ncbi:DUF3105 domain-containing protein [Thermoleophilia bacterium SCSIO 60948]|nr:DUF3105 domain-containing protein [Thermoleophilia bacterium SCSIO 60948]